MNLDPEYQLAALQERAMRARRAHGTGYRSWAFRALGILLVVLRDVAFGQLTLRAMSLVYTTLLSIVPMLALSFSVLKAFGVHNQIEPALGRFLAPLGERGDEVTAQIIQFIGNMNVGVLGSLGLALLLYTAISLVQKIEISFNYIWHVPEPRSFGTRFSSYLSVLLVGPLLVFSALGLTAAATSIGVVKGLLAIEPFGRIAAEVGKLVPYALIIGLFFFIYIFIPNTRVRWTAALGGALVGGIAWQTAGWAFASFVATSAQYTAIYSGFAIVILFMIWIYVSWLILLVGASVSFYLQHGEYIIAKSGEPQMSSRMQERLALLVMQRVAERHAGGGAALSLEELVHVIGLPSYAIRKVLDLMTAKGILVPTRSEPCTWVPVHELAATSAWQVIDAVRSDAEFRSIDESSMLLPDQVQRLVNAQERVMAEVLGSASLQSLVRDEQAVAADAERGVGTAAAAAIAPPEAPEEPEPPEPEVRKDLVA
jgi:membrane protein